MHKCEIMSPLSKSSSSPGIAVPSPESDLFDQAVVGLAYLALDGRFLRVNRAFCDLLGQDEEALAHRNWTQVALDGDGHCAIEIERMLDGDGFNEWFVRPDRHTFEAHVVAKAVQLHDEPAVLVQLYDRTEQSEALASLFAAEQRFRTVINCSSDAIVWLRLHPEHRVLAVNDAAIEATGYSAREFFDDPELQQRIIHPDDWHLLDELATDRAGGALVRWMTRYDELRWMELTVSTLAEVGGSVSELLCVGRDMTDQVVANQTRLSTDARRRALVALTEKDESESDLATLLPEVATTISHLLPVDVVAAWRVDGTDGFHLATELRSTTQTLDSATLEFITRHLDEVREREIATWLDHRGPEGPESDDEWRIRVTSGVAAPIHGSESVAGVLGVYSAARSPIERSDAEYLEVVANALGVLVQRTERDALPLAASWRDPLTRLPGRAGLVESLDWLLGTGRTHPVLVTCCDLDDFTVLNDAWGSGVGDEVLRIAANRLRSLCNDAVVARVGSDDFVIAVALSDGRSAESVAASIHGVVDQPFATSRGSLALTMSVADALAHPGDTPDSVIAGVVLALHEARQAGRRQVRHVSAQVADAQKERTELARDLRRAAKDGEIRPYFQPIVRLPDEVPVSFEALARWKRPDGTFVPPNVFIPLAEETGQILDIGAGILEATCAFLEDVRERTGSDLVTVKVNVSGGQLCQPVFVDQVRDALERHSLTGRSLCLELTESQAILVDPAVELELHRLKELGVDLAIDDFGTGYSNFAYLTQLPIDTLKLDRSMIADLHDDLRRTAVVQAILSLSRTLSFSVIAEGVESEIERDALVGLGCSFGQGFLWSPAVPAEEALAMLLPSSDVDPTAPWPNHRPIGTTTVASPPRRIDNDLPVPSSRFTRADARGCWGYMAVGLALLVLYFVNPRVPGLPDWFPQYPICVLINASAVVAVALGVRRWRPKPALPWWLIAVGQASYTIGDILYYWGRDISHVTQFPGVSDYFYLGRIPFVALGLTLIIHHRGGPKRTALLDSAVIALAAGAISWEFLIAPYTGANLGAMVRLTSLAYPVTDLLLLTLAIRLLIGAGRRAPSFYLLNGGLLLLALTDAIYGWENLHGIVYGTSSPIVGGWMLNYLLIGACALHPSMRDLTARAVSAVPTYSRPRLAALGVAALVCPVIITFEAWPGHLKGDGVVLLTSIVIIALIMVRLAEMMHHQQRAETALRHEALHDPLTGLANRTLFYDRLEHTLQLARRDASGVALLLVDLDDFKKINDEKGHAVGDRVLQKTARRLLECTREPDTVARLGGDEFAVLIHNLTSIEDYSVVARRILAALAAPIDLGRESIRVSGSVGIAFSAAGASPGDQLFNEADAAMYAAKGNREPMGNFKIFDESVGGFSLSLD